MSAEIPLEDWIAVHEGARPYVEAVQARAAALGPATPRASKSQVAFRRRVAFAWLWRPDDWLGGGHAPMVLTLALRRRDPSPRWKEVVEPRPGRFSHHLELWSPDAVDDEVGAWLAEAWDAAG